MNVLKSAIVGMVLISASTPVRADVIGDWNNTAVDVMKAVNVSGNPWTRSMALVNVSMSDAVNSVQNRYSRYIPELPTDPNASAEAAAAAAAREILMRQYPGQKERIEAAFAEAMKTIPDNPARAAGVDLGVKVADAVFTERQSDATNTPDTYRPLTTPGVWVPTTPPLFPQYATAKPWGMESASQFRPGPPPALNSALYARDYNETREMGGVKSTKRTDAQSDVVRFWTQANLGPAWFQAAGQASARHNLSLPESARVFALMSMALANCFILDWDAKFQYNFWRPITAIRNGDQDSNDATERDAGWQPLNTTPMHPEYPSQAGINAGAARTVLEAVFGNGTEEFVATDISDARLSRKFTNFAQLAQEHKEVRIWGGIHFRNSLDVGDAMGRKVADHLAANYMRPTR
ncbi:vanadium-dependent haloperoxidase [Bradyrhizobium sp. JYMT SZCCT0180]|uniref:vanadium-dependent haloperoxidase n=1 Tax=Bradyrhizobium sp. JYMT SZCCT0180 TaxID=2807666 RepID=UPI001BA4E6C6|nr:vanadium-dependent haloperoxidase [Bradyrhizobium sp. JYMT SZCCT0180]MBR1211550.1 vanadium-dependent haloperoxidase [Bradyrhizobium sp. JYMT SZCCT0180]